MQVKPAKLSSAVCDTIRSQLMDNLMLEHLESCGSINGNPCVVWQYRGAADPKEWAAIDPPALCSEMECGYSQDVLELKVLSSFTTFHVDYVAQTLFNASTNATFNIRRLAFAPLMPMKVSTYAQTCALSMHVRTCTFTLIHTDRVRSKLAVPRCLPWVLGSSRSHCSSATSCELHPL